MKHKKKNPYSDDDNSDNIVCNCNVIEEENAVTQDQSFVHDSHLNGHTDRGSREKNC